MSDSSPREIQIGDETHRIARFRGLKAALAGELISRVMQEIPQLQEDVARFRKEFRERNTILITPAMAKTERFAPLGLSTEDFEQAGGNIEFPEEPTAQAMIIHIFPKLFTLCRKELQRFLALLVIRNSDLERADDDERVEEELDSLGKRLLRAGDIDELLELIVVGSEVFKEQMSSKRDILGKLPIPLLQQLLTPPEAEDEENRGPGQTTPIPTETSPSHTPSSVSSSSTDSPIDSDGIEEPLSTVSPG